MTIVIGMPENVVRRWNAMKCSDGLRCPDCGSMVVHKTNKWGITQWASCGSCGWKFRK